MNVAVNPIANLLLLSGSGGGGTPESLDTPAPIELEAAREQTIGVQVIKVGQDANRFRIYSDSGLATLVDEVEQAGNFYEFTGLNQSTQYWVTAEAKFGTSYSDPIQASKFTLVNALHSYNFHGLKTDTENEFGYCGEGAATANQVTQVKSYRGSPNTLRPTGTHASLQNSSDTSHNQNIFSAFGHVIFSDDYQFDNDVDFGSGDFTLLFKTGKNNLLGTARQVIWNSANPTDIVINFNSGGIVCKFGVGASQYIPLWNGSVTAYAEQRLILHLSGTTLKAGIMNQDGSISWSVSPITISKTIFTPIFDSFSASAVSIWYAGFLSFYTSALTDDQIKREFNSYAKDDFVPIVNDFSIAPKGITYSDLDVDNYLIDPNIGYAATSGASWGAIYTHGNYTTYRGAYKDSLQEDFLRTFNHLTGKIGSAVSIGYAGASVDPGGHNLSGLLAPFDNTFYTAEADIHYDQTVPTKLIFKRFGRNFNFSQYTELRRGNGLVAQLGNGLQYEQGMRVGNYTLLLCQEWSGSFAKWLTVLRFKDNCNYPEKIRIAQIAATNWFYPTLLHREDGTIGVFLHYYLRTVTPNRYENSFYIKTSSSAPFDSISNQQGTWTKNIVGSNQAATEAELNTNCIVGATGVGKANDCRVTAAYYDPTNDELYYTKLSGDSTLLVGRSIANGAWSEATVDLNSRPIVCSYGPAGGIGHGSNIPTFVKTGVDSYKGVTEEIISGSILGVAEFQTSNFFSSTTYNGIVSPDNTTLHDRMMVTKNVHHTGGVDAYNEKRLLVCSREQTSPDNHADIWHYEL